MRRLLLATLLLGLASPAHAADEEDDAPSGPAQADDDQPGPVEPPHAPLEEPTAPCPTPPDLKADLVPAYTAACTFFRAVAQRAPIQVGELVRTPFYFEGHVVNGLDDTRKRWTQDLADLRGQPSTFYGLELLTYDDMVKKYGKPPTKLEGWPLKGAMLAVGNLDGRAAVIALKHDGPNWTVFAFHD